MTEPLSHLAAFGATVWAAFAAPMLTWTAVALTVETLARAVRPSASVSLWARGATLTLLPALVGFCRAVATPRARKPRDASPSTA